MKRLIALCLTTFLAVSVAYADKSKGFFQESFGNYQDELKTAKQDGKDGVFVFFMMDECPFCDKMEKTILSQPDVQAYFKQHFSNFIFDIEGDVEVTDFMGKVKKQKEIAEKDFRVRATPVMIFFDLTGKPVARYTGATRNKEEMLLLGKFVVEKQYEKMTFEQYKRQAKE
ncbi:MAG: thioredoxin fold domain-containing protein [Thiotrichales bacterium]|jgi:thioredoxin-related protein|nr:thioredoxin fold domain-containing protein [Thiotrichales bacterium]